MRKDELAAISGPNEFAEFYNRLKQIKEFHRKHPNEVGKFSLIDGLRLQFYAFSTASNNVDIMYFL